MYLASQQIQWNLLIEERQCWGKPQTYQNISVTFHYIIAYVHIKKDVTIIRNHQPQKEGIRQFM